MTHAEGLIATYIAASAPTSTLFFSLQEPPNSAHTQKRYSPLKQRAQVCPYWHVRVKLRATLLQLVDAIACLLHALDELSLTSKLIM
jgi:hypothetical protein